MRFLVSLFWNICLTRKGPEEVPAQYALIGLLILGKIVFVSGLYLALHSEINGLSLTLKVATWAVVLGLLTALVLYVADHFERFIPTFGAILGSDLLVTSLYGAILLGLSVSGIEVSHRLATTLNGVVQLWTIFIVGFIMHRALDLDIGLGIIVGLIISIFTLAISQYLAIQI